MTYWWPASFRVNVWVKIEIRGIDNILPTYNCPLDLLVVRIVFNRTVVPGPTKNLNWKLSYITRQSSASPQPCCRSSWVMIMEKHVQCVFSNARSLQKPVYLLFVATLSSFFSLAFFILNANGTQETSPCVESESKNGEEKGFNFWRSHENPIKPLHKETSSAFTRRPHACGNLSNFNYFGINLGSRGSVCGALLRERASKVRGRRRSGGLTGI